MCNLEIAALIAEINKKITSELFFNPDSQKNIAKLSEKDYDRILYISNAIKQINKDIAYSNFKGALKILIILKKISKK